ncbi:MAG: VWA domain-containing protein [Terriglobales bacterium]
MAKPRFPVFLAIVVLFTTFGVAQSQSDDAVHLTPRSAPAPAKFPEFTGDADILEAHVKPLRVDVDLVQVPVTVTDVRNHPVLDLTKEDFELTEAGQPQQIRYFSSEDQPISVGVLLDLSRSMTNKIEAAREALGQFFDNCNPADDYFVITFADRPSVLADVSRSIGHIQAQLATAEPAGHTALLDAIYMGVHKLRSAQYKRRALLIISDGGDNHSRYSAREIKELVQEADVEIYAIGLFDKVFRTPEEWAGKKLLNEITGATGGRTATVSNLRNLPDVASEISRELRSRYLLGYNPQAGSRDGKWRKLRVRLTPSAKTTELQVYAKRGYQAPAK